MSEPLFDPLWYRVAELKPRLRSHTCTHRHHYRGQLWHILQDLSNGRFHRFTPAAYQVIGLMDGRRTVSEIWDRACEALGDDAPTQSEIVRLLSQLHAADALRCEIPPDTEELLRRHDRQRRQKWKQSLRSPLAIRVPLLDPDRLLTRLMRFVRPLYGWFGAILWLAVVGFGGTLAARHWSELTQNVTDQILTPQNLALVWLMFPLVKALHELGHGFAAKKWGGEVHEMGIMFLVFSPVPYVDASSASAFREKYKRIVVGAAGILVELFLASLALFVWLSVEAGIVRMLAYNVMFIAGVSTVLFNGNPLLRFDGYYVLSDFLEIPNLWTRSSRYLKYLFERYLFGVRQAESPVSAPGEQFWFVVYAIGSFAYRMFLYAVIILFVASKFFFVGIVLAVWAGFSMIIMPTGKALAYLFSSPTIRRRRVRALLASGGVVAALAAAVMWVPVPLATQAQGVIRLPEQSLVRAEADGFVARLLVEPGSPVRQGESVMALLDPALRARVTVLEFERKAVRARLRDYKHSDRVKAEITRDELRGVEARLSRAREQQQNLTVRSPGDGILVVPEAKDLQGRFVRRGELVAYVVGEQVVTLRVVVPQAQADLVRYRTRRVDVRLPEDVGEVIPALLKREVPSASDKLPSAVLGSEGGGVFTTDPRDSSGRKALQQAFQFDVELLWDLTVLPIGGRGFVRFYHGREPLARRWYRSIRQLLLRQFVV